MKKMFNKHWQVKPEREKNLPKNDLRGTPTFACICGCMVFKVNVMWDQDTRAVDWYDLAQECVECGTITTAPTEIDGCE